MVSMDQRMVWLLLYFDLTTLLQKGSSYETDNRLSFIEGARDVAVLDAMLESALNNGALVQVKRF